MGIPACYCCIIHCKYFNRDKNTVSTPVFYLPLKKTQPNPNPKQSYFMIIINCTQPQQTKTAQSIHAHMAPPFPE